jgi:hypothetical protein
VAIGHSTTDPSKAMAMKSMKKVMKSMKKAAKTGMTEKEKAKFEKLEKAEQKAQKKLDAFQKEEAIKQKGRSLKKKNAKPNTGIVVKTPKWMTKAQGKQPKQIPIDVRGVNTIYWNTNEAEFNSGIAPNLSRKEFVNGTEKVYRNLWTNGRGTFATWISGDEEEERKDEDRALARLLEETSSSEEETNKYKSKQESNSSSDLES